MRRLVAWVGLIAVLLIFSVRANADDTESIIGKSGDGSYLGLDDGTKWLIAKGDRSTVEGWSKADDVVTVDSSSSCSSTEIIDVDENNEAACAINASPYLSTITDKSDDGTYLSLDDGTQWIVSDADTSTSGVWNTGEDVLAINSSSICTDYELINADDNGDSVCASSLKNR